MKDLFIAGKQQQLTVCIAITFILYISVTRKYKDQCRDQNSVQHQLNAIWIRVAIREQSRREMLCSSICTQSSVTCFQLPATEIRALTHGPITTNQYNCYVYHIPYSFGRRLWFGKVIYERCVYARLLEMTNGTFKNICVIYCLVITHLGGDDTIIGKWGRVC